MWNISAWLDEIENTPTVEAHGTKRKRDDEIAASTSTKRRQLVPMDANTNPGRTSPRKSMRKPKAPPVPIFEDDDTAPAPARARAHPHPHPPSTPRARSKPSAADAASGEKEVETEATADVMLEAEEETPRSRPAEKFQMRFPAPRQPDSVSHSSRSSAYTSRSKSPVKDTVDLKMADSPIFQLARRDTPLPKCLLPLIKRLERIKRGNGVVPAIAKDTMDREVAEFDAHWVTESAHSSDERDMADLLDIAEDARNLEELNQAEAAWNSEAHSPILRVALRSLHGRVTHYNVTQVRPISEYLPTRGTRISEARLVDYAITISPTRDEERDILRLLQEEPDNTATISQSRATILRTHPVAISIETKADSGSTSEAKNQLGVWAYAHFQRMRTLLGLEENVPPGEESIMAVHPIIYVSQHRWFLALMVARNAGTEFAEIDLRLCIGGTDSLFELWKLRASLRCLGQWAEEQYWPALHQAIRVAADSRGYV